MIPLLNRLTKYVLSAFIALRAATYFKPQELPVVSQLKLDRKRIRIQAAKGGYNLEQSSDAYIRDWNAACDQREGEATRDHETKIASNDTRIGVINTELSEVSDEERRNKHAIKLKPERDAEILAQQKEHTDTRHKLDLLEQDKSNVVARIIEIENEQTTLPEKRRFLDNPVVLLICVLADMILGTLFVVPIFTRNGFDTWEAYLLSYILSALVILCCYCAGESFASKDKMKAFTWLSVGLTVVFSIVCMRVMAKGNWILSIINLAIVAASYLWSCRYHARKYIADLFATRDSLDSKIIPLQTQVTHHPEENAALEDRFNQRVVLDAQAEIDGFKRERQNLVSNSGDHIRKIDDIKKETATEREKGVIEINQYFEQGRRTRLNGKGPSMNFGPLIIVCLLLFAACSPSSNQKRKHVMIGCDKSLSVVAQDTVSIAKVSNFFLQQVFHLDSASYSEGGINAYLGVIGAPSIPAITTTRELPPLPSYFLRNEIKLTAQIDSFSNEFKSDFQALMLAAPNQPYTNLSRNFSYLLRYLIDNSEENSDRSVYFFTDLIESSHIIQFEKFKRNPALLDSLYPKISEAMAKDSPMPNLSGIRIFIIYNSRLPNDELSYAAFRYWRKYLTGLGAKVEILPIPIGQQ